MKARAASSILSKGEEATPETLSLPGSKKAGQTSALFAEMANPVPLSQSLADWLTLLTPTSVFEGDSVVLTCQRKGDWKVKTMTYYKDGKVLQFLNKASSFPIPSAVLSDSGNYHCTATGRKYFQKTDISAIVNIEVQGKTPLLGKLGWTRDGGSKAGWVPGRGSLPTH